MGQTQTLSSSLIGAFTPALTVIEGSGNREHMIDMAFRMCKFGVFLILVFAIPLMLEINEVLRLWLKTPPFYTAELCLCMIIVLVFDKATIGHMTAITACGKVALYQAFLGTNLMLTFPVAWMFLRYNVGVLAIGYAFCLMAGTALFGRLFFAKYLIGMSIVRWGRTVFFPLVFVGTPVFLLGVGVKYFYPPSPIRVCFISFICFSVLLSLGWFFVLDKKERIFFISNLTRLRRKKTEFDCMKPILPDNETCCGCSVCVAVCPTQAISMLPDVEGFLQPIVEENKCVLCHLCETTCPVLGTHISSEFVRGGGHLVKAKDDTLRLQSSSGGVFSLLARNILEQEGVVYGAGWERSTMRVVHARATNEDQLSALRGSKYVQSDVGEAYTSVKKDLDAGLHVLFSGCPCQIAGLRTFLKKQYKNLLLVDFICHGVASPGIFALFLKSLSKEKKISDFIFRYKPKAWKSFHTLIRFGDGSSSLSPWTSTLFGRGWACGWFIRRSCFQCQVKGFSSGADLTLSDAWGIEHFAKDFEDEKGISCVYALNSHGTNFLEKILKNTSSICVPFEKAVSFQPSAFHSKQSDPVCGFSWKKRNRLRKKMLEGQVTLDQTMTVLVHRSVFDKLKTRLYRFWGMAVKKGKM